MLVARAGAAAVPPVPAPRPVLPFVNFTRLPEKALANVRRALDDDPGFRERVRSSVTVSQVRSAGWLFLTRPEGWEEELDALGQAAEKLRLAEAAERQERTAVRRLTLAEEAGAEAQRAAASLREELDRVTPLLTEERRARRAVETDAGRLRAQLAELERELAGARAASTDAAPSVVGVEGQGAGLDEARAALSAERRRVAALEERCRVAEARLAKVGPPAPGPESAERAEAAEALAAVAGAVGVLAEAVAAAASRLAPFLPPSPAAVSAPAEWPPPDEPAAPPAGRRSRPPTLDPRPAPIPPGLADDSPEAAEHLVRQRDAVVLVDGYNVTKLGRPELSLPEQRRWLTDAAAALAARSGADIEVVFDGADDEGGTPLEPPRRTKVRVRWSPAGTEADDVLLDLVEAMRGGRPVVVVSNDRRVRSGAGRRGANVVGSDVFLGLLGQRPA